ncbi:hypothetical protein P7K49_023058, partial [Saguinus oedipus]
DTGKTRKIPDVGRTNGQSEWQPVLSLTKSSPTGPTQQEFKKFQSLTLRTSSNPHMIVHDGKNSLDCHIEVSGESGSGNPP